MCVRAPVCVFVCSSSVHMRLIGKLAVGVGVSVRGCYRFRESQLEVIWGVVPAKDTGVD